MIRTEEMEKYHNDEKVMREVKFIRKEDQRNLSPIENLRTGGTDHQHI